MPCFCLKTGHQYAVKILKSNINVNDEVGMLYECQGHQNILSLVELLKDEKYIYIVTDLIVGTQLHDYAGIASDDAKNIFSQLVDAVHFMHSKNIAHRDIKLENIMVSNSHPKTVTIVDFGFASRQHDDSMMTQTCFTLDYVAPEILENVPYTKKCDVWSLGVILYILLCGEAPFRPDNEDCSTAQHIDQIAAKISKGTFTESYTWSKVSNSARDLIKGMLVVDPKDRFKIDDVINHEWLSTYPIYHKSLSATTCSSHHTSSSTKALINSKIDELSDAYNNVYGKINNSKKSSFVIETNLNESIAEHNNNKDFSLTLSDDDDDGNDDLFNIPVFNDKDIIFNDSIGSELWDEDFHGFNESDDFYGFENKMEKNVNDLTENKQQETKSLIIDKEIKALTTRSGRKIIKVNEIKVKPVKTIKPKVVTTKVIVNKRNRKIVPEIKKEESVVGLRRTGRITKQIIKIEPIDWIEEEEAVSNVDFQVNEIKPAKITRGAKRRNEIDDRDWISNNSSKRRK